MRIAAFGGSAGSLETFREILPSLPSGIGYSYVFITHLPRTHVSEIPRLFSRYTRMPVFCADAPRELAPDHLYVIAPNVFLTLRGSTLHARQRRPEERNVAVNIFFASLAAAAGPRAIGFQLSGAGSDGVKGLQAIAAHGGATFAQEPTTAQFGSMPKAAIRAGAAQVVVSPDQIPFHLFRLAREERGALRAS